jgi:hypothetical protein
MDQGKREFSFIKIFTEAFLSGILHRVSMARPRATGKSIYIPPRSGSYSRLESGNTRQVD